MTAPRQVIAGTTYLVTRRCTQRQFLLKPSALTNALFGYLLAVAAARYGIAIHAYVVLSNHYHLVVTDRLAQLPAFSQLLDALVARAMNASYGRWENLWAPSSYSAVALTTKNAIVAKAVYTLANPVVAALVAQGRQWPGLWSSPDTFGGPAITFPRPAGFFDPKGQMPTACDLALEAPPGFTVEEFRQRVREGLARAERRVANLLAKLGKRPLGVRRVLRQRHTDQPRSRERRRGLKPRVAGPDRWKRVEALGRLKSFLDRHAEALARWREGLREIVFPVGTYAMRVFHGAACASAG